MKKNKEEKMKLIKKIDIFIVCMAVLEGLLVGGLILYAIYLKIFTI